MLSELPWYWVLAIILGYLAIGALLAAIMHYVHYGKFDGDFEDEAFLYIFAWPFLLILVVLLGTPYCLYKLFCLAGKGIQRLIDEIVWKIKYKEE